MGKHGLVTCEIKFIERKWRIRDNTKKTIDSFRWGVARYFSRYQTWFRADTEKKISFPSFSMKISPLTLTIGFFFSFDNRITEQSRKPGYKLRGRRFGNNRHPLSVVYLSLVSSWKYSALSRKWKTRQGSFYCFKKSSLIKLLTILLPLYFTSGNNYRKKKVEKNYS